MKKSENSERPFLKAALLPGMIILFTLSIWISPAVGQERESREYPPPMEGASEVAVYKTVGDTELKLYIFQPEGYEPGDQNPAIMFYFGGGWRTGSPQQWHRQCLYFASRGITAISVDYRVSSRHNSTPTDATLDAKSSVRWVKQNADRLGIDPSRIAALGASAGGQMAAALGIIDDLDEPDEDLSVSSSVDALILYNPALIVAPVEGIEFGRGSPAGDTDEERTAISPYHHISQDDPPTITFHGKADETIPYNTVEVFDEKMKEHGNRSEVVLYDDAGHGFFNSGFYYTDVLRKTDQFLVSLGYLEGEPTIEYE